MNKELGLENVSEYTLKESSVTHVSLDIVPETEIALLVI